MTKKDYLKAVKAIQHFNTTESQYQMLIEVFVKFFEDDNPNFDPKRFREACE